MNREKLIEILTSEFGWSRGAFEVWEKAGFRCGYCNRDFLQSLDSYKQAKIDHLLPQSNPKYAKLINSASNHVLSCDVCNNLKRNWSPLGDDEVLDGVESGHLTCETRNELLSRAVGHVREKRIEREVKFLREKKLLWEWMVNPGD